MQQPLKADITLYTADQGGLNASTPAEWFSCTCFVNTDSLGEGWDCRILLGGHPMQPGEKRQADVLFLSGQKAVDIFANKEKFFLWRGKFIGEARLL